MGHVHAVQFVLNLRHHRVVLHGALRHLVERELHIIPGDPLAEDSALMDAMVEQTLQRSVRLVRARVQEDGSALCEERRGKTIAAAILALTAMVNTNIMVPRDKQQPSSNQAAVEQEQQSSKSCRSDDSRMATPQVPLARLAHPARHA